MQKVIDFICAYWQMIVYVLSIVLMLVLFIVRKRNKINLTNTDLKEELLELLPYFIFSVEKMCLPGTEKKEAVIKTSLDCVSKWLHRDLTEEENKTFTQFISDAVESILETPQKKGEK